MTNRDYTATELAKLAGVSSQHIRRLCKRWAAAIPPGARKSGDIWLIRRETGNAFIRQKKRFSEARNRTFRKWGFYVLYG